MDGFNNLMERTEEKIGELKDRKIEFSQFEQQRKNSEEKLSQAQELVESYFF